MNNLRRMPVRFFAVCALALLVMAVMSFSAGTAKGTQRGIDPPELVLSIPSGTANGDLDALYPISFIANGRYHEIKTGIHSDQQTIFNSNRQAIDIISRKRTFLAYSHAGLAGSFRTSNISHASGLSCESTFSPVGKLSITAPGKGREDIALFITENNRTKPSRFGKNINESLKKKLLPLIAGKLKSFGLNIDRIAYEDIKLIQMTQQQNDLVIAMTKNTLSAPRKFYESSRELDEITTLSIFHLKNSKAYPLYLPNPNEVIFTEFIWAGDIEGDGDVEIILREAYGEFGKFVIFRFQRDQLIKVFEGTDYGC